jgi:hypothetical protein
MLADILDDVFPAFTVDNDTVTIRRAKGYKPMRDADLLKTVNIEALKDRLLKLTELGGKVGRPKKARSVA